MKQIGIAILESLHFSVYVNIITSVYTWILFICTGSYTNKHNIYMSTYQQEYSYLHYLLCTNTRVYICTKSWLIICTHLLVYIRPQFCQNTKTSNKLRPFPPFTAPSSVCAISVKQTETRKKTQRTWKSRIAPLNRNSNLQIKTLIEVFHKSITAPPNRNPNTSRQALTKLEKLKPRNQNSNPQSEIQIDETARKESI